MPPTDYRRESIYLSDNEQTALQWLAREFNISKNGVIKILIRDAAGLPLPDQYLERLRNKAGSSARINRASVRVSDVT